MHNFLFHHTSHYETMCSLLVCSVLDTELEDVQTPLSVPSSGSASTDNQRDPSLSPSPTPVRAPKRNRSDSWDGDRALIQSLKDLQDGARDRRRHKEDMDFNFALEVAGRLKRMTPRQNALAKLQIQQLLFNIEFSEENSDETLYGNHQNAYMFQ